MTLPVDFVILKVQCTYINVFKLTLAYFSELQLGQENYLISPLMRDNSVDDFVCDSYLNKKYEARCYR